MPLLVGTDGSAKMSKSLGNYIGITEDPVNMYGKVMSIPDSLISTYYQLALNYNQEQIKELKTILEINNPMISKMKLAFLITEKYHNSKEAEVAQDEFISVHRKHETPKEIPNFEIPFSKTCRLIDFMTEANLTTSKGEAKRLIQQGGVEVNELKIMDPFSDITLVNDMVIKAGKRNFIKVKIASQKI